jgi:hypothetical protein
VLLVGELLVVALVAMVIAKLWVAVLETEMEREKEREKEKEELIVVLKATE